jgi:hypothetical protein
LIIYYAAILGGTLVGTALLFGPKEFFVFFQEGWKALTDFIVHKVTLWPDMYLAVGELRSTNFSELMAMTINPIFFGVALIGFVCKVKQLFSLSVKNDIERYRDLILLVYFIIVSVMTLKAQRFSFLYLVPFSFLFVLGCEQIFLWIKLALQKSYSSGKYRPLLSLAICGILVVAVIFDSIRNASLRTPRLVTVFYNDTWDQVMNGIRQQTPEDSIINSWWPAGHFIKAMGHRRVIFDGATINQPQAYWVAQVLLSGNERYSLGVLRMLNGSSNEAPDYLQQLHVPLPRAIMVLRSIVGLNSSEASTKLKRFIPEENIPHLLSLTHTQVPPVYLLIHNELVEKNILVNFIGHWDFQKAQDLHPNLALRGDLLAPGHSSYVQRLWSLAGGQPRYSGLLSLVAQDGTRLVFQNNVAIDLETKTCQINSPLYGKGVPQSLFFLDGDEFVEKKFPNANLTYSVALVERGGGYYSILLERDTARSMLIRMFYFGGKGLKFLEPVTQAADSTHRTEIYLYRVNWEKFMEYADK